MNLKTKPYTIAHLNETGILTQKFNGQPARTDYFTKPDSTALTKFPASI
jgi:hypothetical protein